MATLIRDGRVLVVEDNPDLAFGLRNNREIEGYEVDVAESGPGGLERAREGKPDLVILDLMLPGFDGYRVLRTLRDDGLGMPVLILTARGEEADKVRGFRLGADDYVTKPFGVLELLARVEALLRRTRPGPVAPASSHSFGDIDLDLSARIVRRSAAVVALTPIEIDVLVALLKRTGAAVLPYAPARSAGRSVTYGTTSSMIRPRRRTSRSSANPSPATRSSHRLCAASAHLPATLAGRPGTEAALTARTTSNVREH